MEIVVPHGALVVLIGVAGSGKSTFAARHFRPDEVLSSDAYRAIVGSGEWDQSASRPAFAALHRELSRRLAAGRTIVVDATNVTGWARRGLLARAAAAGRPAIAIVLDLPEDVSLAQNAHRPAAGRVPVPEPAVRQQSRDLRRALRDRDGLLQEGFGEVHRFGGREAIDAVRIVRRAPPETVTGLLPLAAATEREDPTER